MGESLSGKIRGIMEPPVTRQSLVHWKRFITPPPEIPMPEPKQDAKKWQQGWATIADKHYFFRSLWEVNYARYLQWLKDNGQIVDWEFEVDTFWFDGIKRGVCSYLPDFKVFENDGKIVYHEVKGYFDSRSKTKIKRMAKYHPDIKIVLIDKSAYLAIARKAQGFVPDWNNVPVKEAKSQT